MIAEMKKVILIGPKYLAQSVVEALQETGTVHLVESEAAQKRTDDRAAADLAAHEKTLARIETILVLLPKTGVAATPGVFPADIEPWLNHLAKTSHDLSQQRQNLADELAVLQAYRGAVQSLVPLLEPLRESKNFEAVGFLAARKELRRLEQLETELAKTFQGKVLVFRRVVDENNFGLVIAYPKAQLASLRPILTRFGLNELKMPSSLAAMSLPQAVVRMEVRVVEIPAALREIDGQFARLALEHRPGLAALKLKVENEITALKAMKSLGHTQKTFLISGFNPAKSIERLCIKIQQRFEGKVHVDVEECHDAPTLLDNPRLVRPFEMFIKILQPPKYGSIDPTPFFAFFFPIFFGLIMGDVGYGLVFLTIGLVLRFKTTKLILKHVSEVVLYCAGYTILFGIIFGEFFGDWLEKMGILHPWTMQIGSLTVEWNRMHSLLPLLMLAIGIGVFHVTLGFILKLIHSIRRRHHHETIEVAAILTALAALFTLIGAMAQQVSALAKIPSAVALAVAIPLLVLMKGPLMIMELLSFVGNMLSYARIMAIGVASAYLAFVANMLGGLMGNVVIGAIVAILFHMINMMLAFSPTIQSARLHYVEFFSKFYEAGNRTYRPFMKKIS